MAQRIVLALVVVLLSVAAVGQVRSEKLIIERLNGRDPDRGDNAAIRITIDFCPDGLIRSYEEKYYDKESKAQVVGKSFTVEREEAGGIETLKQAFSQAGQNPTSFVSIRHSGSISVRFSQPGRADSTLEITPAKEVSPPTTVYRSVVAGNTVLEFRFTSEENRIEARVMARGKTFRERHDYRVDSGLAVIACQTPDNIRYDTELLSKDRTVINVINGPLDESFIVAGHPKRLAPEIAVMNFGFLWDDPGLGNAIYPYVGGSPE